MSVKVENLEHNLAKITVEVAADDFKKAVETVYNRQKKSITIPGFRKGKAPLMMVERHYGAGIFFEDAANICINNTYPDALKESGVDCVSDPEINVEQIEKGKDFIYTATVATKPEVTLGEYKGLEVPKSDVTVTDEDVEAALVREQEKNSRLIDVDDRAVEDGDSIVLDYSGAVDGVKFDGGTAEDADLVIGSGSFIPGFEEQLIGVAIGESKDVVVTFPEEYHAEDLAGKEAVFACTVKKIQKKELPALDDDFAQDVSEFDTLEEYKADLRKGMEERKAKAAQTDKENAAVAALIEKCEMDIPGLMVATQVNQMYTDMAQRLQAQGLQMSVYLQYMGMTEPQFLDTLKPEAMNRIKSRLALEAVAKAENIEISDEAIKEEIQKMADAYQMEVEKLEELMSDREKEQMKEDLAVQQAVTLLAENAVEVDAPAEEDAE